MYPIQRTTALVRQLLSAHATGTVHSVYRKTINLSFDGTLVALQAAGSPLSPISLITTLAGQEMSHLPVSAGLPVSLTADTIHLAETAFCLDAAETVETVLMPVSESDLPSLTAQIRSILKHSTKGGFRNILFPSDKPTQLGEQLVLAAAENHMNLCSQELCLFHYTTAAHSLSSLIGLGIGLTPSGDDFLCGVLAGLILRNGTDHPFFAALQEQITQKLPDTNDISRAFLHCALQGQFSEAICSLRHASDAAQLSAAFSAIGHSSGMDTLCGILYALTLSLPG
ncbi:MAG: DUF2877 domain-containing protein [Clostridiales bacterium]|nr:DUF2877 domain-containing protein [Clostridiales bacterium]